MIYQRTKKCHQSLPLPQQKWRSRYTLLLLRNRRRSFKHPGLPCQQSTWKWCPTTKWWTRLTRLSANRRLRPWRTLWTSSILLTCWKILSEKKTATKWTRPRSTRARWTTWWITSDIRKTTSPSSRPTFRKTLSPLQLKIKTHPLLARMAIIHQGYSKRSVKSVDSQSSARNLRMNLSPTRSYSVFKPKTMSNRLRQLWLCTSSRLQKMTKLEQLNEARLAITSFISNLKRPWFNHKDGPCSNLAEYFLYYLLFSIIKTFMLLGVVGLGM